MRPLSRASGRPGSDCTTDVRRRLPSLDGLRAFEVAARRLSFTAAAAELCVTQGAVSQRIKALEDELGVALFERRARGLALTPHGSRVAEGVRLGLDHIATALAALADESGRPLVVSVLPSFASRWLVPRLHRFAACGPAVEIQLLAENGLIDPRNRAIHAALRFGTGRYAGFAATLLMGDSIVPVCSPRLLAAAGPIAAVPDLARLPILHDSATERDGSGTDWESWLEAAGHPGLRLAAGQRFSQADLLLDAAANGLGVALGRTSLITDDIAARRLVRLDLPEVPTPYAYYLIHRPELGEDRRVVRLRDWLLAECRAFSPA
jgi:LysR family glycine cleavage system transcriptional activator